MSGVGLLVSVSVMCTQQIIKYILSYTLFHNKNLPYYVASSLVEALTNNNNSSDTITS